MDEQQQSYLRKSNIPFTMVANAIIFDNRISSKAKFYYVYLSSKPDGWKFHTNCIIKEIKEGRDAFYSGLKELIQFGYLERMQIKEGGKFKHTDFVLKIPSYTENTDTVKTSTENTDDNNTDIKNKDIKNKEAKLASKPAFNSFERDDPHIEIGAQPKPKPTQQASKQSLSDKQQEILRAYHNSLKATSTLDSERIDEILHAEEKQKAALTSIENYLIESGETVPQLEEIFKNKHAQYANKEQGYAGLRLFASDDCAVLREQKSQKVVKLQKKQEIDKKTADKNAQIKQDILDIKEAFAANKLERTQDKDNVTEKLNLPFNSYKDIADKILQATIHGVYWWDGRKVLIVEHADVDFLAEYQVYINNAILRANVAIDRIINIKKHD